MVARSRTKHVTGTTRIINLLNIHVLLESFQNKRQFFSIVENRNWNHRQKKIFVRINYVLMYENLPRLNLNLSIPTGCGWFWKSASLYSYPRAINQCIQDMRFVQWRSLCTHIPSTVESGWWAVGGIYKLAHPWLI